MIFDVFFRRRFVKIYLLDHRIVKIHLLDDGIVKIHLLDDRIVRWFAFASGFQSLDFQVSESRINATIGLVRDPDLAGTKRDVEINTQNHKKED